MSYESYKAYLETVSSPASEYGNDLQAMVDAQIDNASSYYTIQEETAVGSLSWQDVTVRINHVVRSDTGEKLGDDFKSIIFKDFDHARSMGCRYQFDNNVWITINTDQKKYVTASSVIRRCNNTLQMRKADGTLVQEPCFIDYGYTSDSFNIFKETVLADGEILVGAQNNANTQLFDINDTVIFGGQYFKIESKKNFLNNTTYGDDAPIITFKMALVNASGDDDITPTGEILVFINGENVDIHNLGIIEDDTTTFVIYRYENGYQESDTFVFTVDSLSQANPVNYTFNTINGNSFSVKNNNKDDNDLIILCTNNVDTSTEKIAISLRGLW